MSPSTGNPIHVAREIRRIHESVSFAGAVRARTVPVLAIAESWALGPYDNVDWFSLLNPMVCRYHPEALVAEVFGAIAGWRQSLLQELEYVGFAVTLTPTGQLDVNHALVRRRREGEILTDSATPGGLRSEQYLILAQDVLQEFGPYLKLRYLLNSYKEIASAQRTKPEAVFQKFFEEHPHLIRRDLFDRHWTQPSLRVPGDAEEYLRPDFVLRPRVGAEVGTKWQILDLKLPDDPLVVSQGFHATLSAKLTRAIQQLQDYREYFNRADASAELINRFGARPQNPRLAVLIGRRVNLEDASALDRAQGPRFLDVEVLTYDEIVDLEANRLVLHSALARVF